MRLKATNERAPFFQKIAATGEQVLALDNMGRVWVYVPLDENTEEKGDGWMMLGRSVFELAED